MKKIVIILLLFLFLDFFYTKSVIIKKNRDIGIRHDIFHHTFLSNYTYTRLNSKFGNYTITTNSLGFRDSKIREIDLKNNKRIVLIGDSFIEGVLLEYEDTVAGILEKKFKKKNIDLLNAAVSSYSPIIYYTKIKYYLDKGLKFSNLVVFIDMSDIIDEIDEYDYDEIKMRVITKKKGLKEKYSRLNFRNEFIAFLKNNFYLNYKLASTVDDKLVEPFIKDFSKNISENEYINLYINRKTLKGTWTSYENAEEKYVEGIEKSIKYMSLLKKITDENNIKLTIVVYPYFSQIFNDEINSLHVKIWENFSKKNNIQFINLFPDFIQNNKNLNKYDKIKKNFIPYDVHWNKNGSKKVANSFFEKYKY